MRGQCYKIYYGEMYDSAVGWTELVQNNMTTFMLVGLSFQYIDPETQVLSRQTLRIIPFYGVLFMR
jgi:hypothetical protein